MFVIRNTEQIFPSIEKMLSIREAQDTLEYVYIEAKFSNLWDLCHSKKNLTERQNVSLAVNLFDIKNLIAQIFLKMSVWPFQMELFSF